MNRSRDSCARLPGVPALDDTWLLAPPPWWPLLAFTLGLGALEVFPLDHGGAEMYFDTSSGSGWEREPACGGLATCCIGRTLAGPRRGSVRAPGWGLSFAMSSLRPGRRGAGFIVLAMMSSTLIVGGLKSVTNVDCPWDLAGFGGHNPYVALFADRPDALSRARCFPGAHSSSGFALVCFYFVYVDRSPRLARWLLAGAIAVGVAFSIGQEARGAHFLSHDLTSAAIVWFVQLGMYVWLRRDQARAPISRGRWIPQSTKSNSSMCSGRWTRKPCA